MNIINKTRLVHLSNTTRITTETRLSPKFWAKCAAIISSMATMEASADNTFVSNSAADALVLGSKISSSGSSPYKSLTLAGTGVKIIDYDNSSTSEAAPYTAAFKGDTFVTGGTVAITNGGAFGGSGGGLVVLAKDTTLQATIDSQAKINWASATSAIGSGFSATSYTLANAIQLGLAQAQNTVISGSAGTDQGTATATITVDTGDTLTLTGIISEANTGGSTPTGNILAIGGAGTVILAGASNNTFTGGTTVSDTAILQISSTHAIPAIGAITLGAGTKLRSTVAATLANSAGNASSTSDGILLSGDASIDVQTDSTLTTIINKVINVSSGTVHHVLTATNSGTGVGTLVLANTANSTTGQYIDLTINPNSIVSVADDTNIPGGTLTLNGGKLLVTGGSSAKPFTMNDDSYIGGTFTHTGDITGHASVAKNLHIYTGTVTLNNNHMNDTNTARTNLVVDTGATLNISAANNLTGGTLTLAGGTLQTSTGIPGLGKIITVGTDGGTLDTVGNTSTLDQGMTGANTLTITSSGGAGTIILADGKDNSAATTSLTVLTNGILQFTKTNNLPANATTLRLRGGTLQVPANNGTNATVPVGTAAVLTNYIINGSSGAAITDDTSTSTANIYDNTSGTPVQITTYAGLADALVNYYYTPGNLTTHSAVTTFTETTQNASYTVNGTTVTTDAGVAALNIYYSGSKVTTLTGLGTAYTNKGASNANVDIRTPLTSFAPTVGSAATGLTFNIGKDGGTIDVGDSSTLTFATPFVDATGHALTIQNTAHTSANGILAFTQYDSGAERYTINGTIITNDASTAAAGIYAHNGAQITTFSGLAAALTSWTNSSSNVVSGSSTGSALVSFTHTASAATIPATDNTNSHTAITVGTGVAGTSHITYQISDPHAKEIPAGGGTDNGSAFTGTQPIFTLNGGTLATHSVFSSSDITTAKVITLGANSNVNVDSNTTLTLNGVLAGGYALNANGLGTLVLGGVNNTVSGQSLTITSGTVQVSNINNVPGSSTPAIALAGGTFEPRNSFVTDVNTGLGALANPLTLSHASTLKVGTGITLESTGALTGLYTLEKTGDGTYYPNNDNSSSATSIKLSGGTIQITSSNHLPGSGTLTMNGGTLLVPTGASSDYTVSMPSALGLTMTADSTINVQGGHATANSLTINNTSGFADTIGYTLTLDKSSGTNAAIVSLASGVNNATSHTNLKVNSGVTMKFASGSNIPGATVTSYTINGVVVTDDSTTTAAGIYTHNGAQITTFADLAAAFTSWTSSHANVVSVSNTGSALTSFTSNAGQLTLNGGTITPTLPTLTIASPVNISAASTFDTANAISYTINGTTYNATDTNVDTTIDSLGIWNHNGTPAQITTFAGLAGALTDFSTPSNIKIGATSALDGTTVSTFTSASTSTISGLVAFTNGLTVSGGNKLVLSHANTGTSGITMTGTGTTLSLANATAGGSGTITLGTGTNLETAISGDAGTIANPIALSATANHTATISATNGIILSGVISGAADLTITGTGKTVALSGTNTNTGKTILGGTVTLSIGAAAHLGNTSSVTMGNGTTIHVTAGGFSLPPLVL